MTVEIFICTYKRDFRYLKYCLASIKKFAHGFSGVTILVPEEDHLELVSLVQDYKGQTPIRCKYGTEWKGEGKGFLWHAFQIMLADAWCDADFIYHFDPDCIFTRNVTPGEFFRDGKPILRFESYETLGRRHAGVLLWQQAAEACLPFKVPSETMRAHCMVYRRDLYMQARARMQAKTNLPLADYVQGCKGTFPQTFAEFPTLGAVAMNDFPGQYYLHDCGQQKNPDFQEVPVFQAWSHAPPEDPVALWRNGVQGTFAPIQVYQELGIA